MWAAPRTRDNREEMRVDISVAREALERAAVFTLVRGTTLPTTVLTVHAGGEDDRNTCLI